MPEKKKDAHHKHSKEKAGATGGKGKKKGGLCSCLAKPDAAQENEEREPLLKEEPEESDFGGDDYKLIEDGDDDDEEEELSPIPLTIVVPPQEQERKPASRSGPGPGPWQEAMPTKTSKTCWGNRPRLVEITLFLYNLAYRASIPLKEQLVFGVVATQYSPSVDDFTMSNDDRLQACLVNMTTAGAILQQEIIQADSAQFLGYLNLAKCIPALFSTLFICSLSDSFGRKMGLFLPCVGGLVNCLVWAYVVNFEKSLTYLYIGCVADGVFGSYITLQSVTYAYFADITSTDRRSMRFVSAVALVFVATGLGNVAVGHMIAQFGYLDSFYVIATLFGIAGLHVLVFLPETCSTVNQKQRFSVVYTCKRAVSVFTMYFRSSNPQTSATKLRFLIIVFVFESLIALGRNDVDLLYIVAAPFCWTSVMVGYFQASGFLLKAVAGFMLIPVMQLWLSSCCICFIGCALGVAGSVVMTIADTSYLLWTVAVINLGTATIIPMTEAMMSAAAAPGDQAELFASIGVAEVLCDIVGTSGFDLAYAASAHFFRGLVFVVMAALYVFAAFILFFMWTAYYYANAMQSTDSTLKQIKRNLAHISADRALSGRL